MADLRDTLISLVPWRLRQLMRRTHRGLVFRRAMRRFLKAPAACARPGNRTLHELIYGWGNELWSARDEYLIACIEDALITEGPILECGSGLSTVLVGAIGMQRGGIPHFALEHSAPWASRVDRYLKRYHIASVKLCVADLKSYGEFDWYDPPLQTMPSRFSLVVCDGPPGSTRGGRYGLAPVMQARLAPGCVILLDDASRVNELAIATRWQAELGASSVTLGEVKPYIRMNVVPEGSLR